MSAQQAGGATAGTCGLRVLLVVGADTRDRALHEGLGRRRRRPEFLALQESLGADVLDWGEIGRSGLGRALARAGGRPLALAGLAVARAGRYDAVYCDDEVTGARVALLLKVLRREVPLVVLAHRPTGPEVAPFLQVLRVQSRITTLLLVSTAQRDALFHGFKVPAGKLQLLPYAVDTNFWRSRRDACGPRRQPLVLAAALEHTDYPALAGAVDGLDADVVLAAGRHWGPAPPLEETLRGVPLPANVTAGEHGHEELRALYEASSVVVVPLREVDFQAGVACVLEAMAMGRPVVLTRAQGQGDVIVDRRAQTRSGPVRSSSGRFTAMFADDPDSLTGATGLYVAPDDPKQLRQAVEYLLANPEVAAEMGRRGQATAERVMSLERFVERVRGALAAAVEARWR